MSKSNRIALAVIVGPWVVAAAIAPVFPWPLIGLTAWSVCSVVRSDWWK